MDAPERFGKLARLLVVGLRDEAKRASRPPQRHTRGMNTGGQELTEVIALALKRTWT